MEYANEEFSLAPEEIKDALKHTVSLWNTASRLIRSEGGIPLEDMINFTNPEDGTNSRLMKPWRSDLSWRLGERLANKFSGRPYRGLESAVYSEDIATGSEPSIHLTHDHPGRMIYGSPFRAFVYPGEKSQLDLPRRENLASFMVNKVMSLEAKNVNLAPSGFHTRKEVAVYGTAMSNITNGILDAAPINAMGESFVRYKTDGHERIEVTRNETKDRTTTWMQFNTDTSDGTDRNTVLIKVTETSAGVSHFSAGIYKNNIVTFVTDPTAIENVLSAAAEVFAQRDRGLPNYPNLGTIDEIFDWEIQDMTQRPLSINFSAAKFIREQTDK